MDFSEFNYFYDEQLSYWGVEHWYIPELLHELPSWVLQGKFDTKQGAIDWINSEIDNNN